MAHEFREGAPGGCETVDVAALARGLRSGLASEAWMADWLALAGANRTAFLAALKAHAQGSAASCASAPPSSVNPYKCFVGAHGSSDRTAFAAWVRGQQRVCSYRELVSLTGRLAKGWTRAGLKTGAVVALVVPFGVEYVVALLTCLRMGLVAAPITPCGPAWVDRRLEALAPDAMFAGADEGMFEDKGPIPRLPWVREEDGADPGAFPYDPSSPALRLFSPYATEPLKPVDVSAGALLDGARCDAILTFHLDTGDVVACPGWEAGAVQPTLLLAVLLAGACWAEIPVPDLLVQPSLMAEFGVTMLGVSPPVHDLMLANKHWEAAPLRAWFRNLLDPGADPWGDLTNRTATRGISSFSVALAPCAGGALVFSPPLLTPQAFHCWLVPARDYQISQLGSVQLPALDGTGLLTPWINGQVAQGVPSLVLGRRQAGHTFAGCLQVGRRGQVYPEQDLVALVRNHPRVRRAMVLVTPRRALNDATVTLLAFCSPDGVDPGEAATNELRSLIRAGLGQALMPDRIEWIPLRPRCGAQGLDRPWCAGQYLSGALKSKSADRRFRLLSQLAEIAELHLGGTT